MCALKGYRVDTNSFWKNVIECAIILLVVTLLACLLFSVSVLALEQFDNQPLTSVSFTGTPTISTFETYGFKYLEYVDGNYNISKLLISKTDDTYLFYYPRPSDGKYVLVACSPNNLVYQDIWTIVDYDYSNGNQWQWGSPYTFASSNYHGGQNMYSLSYTEALDNYNTATYYIPQFNSYTEGLAAVRNFIDNPPSDYSKNPNVNVIVANTFISMGIEGTQSQLLTLADGYWEYMTDSENASSPRGGWDIQSVVNRWNMMSNAYKSLQLGYSISSEQLNSMRSFLNAEVIDLVEVSATENYWQAEYNGSEFTYDPNYGLSLLGGSGSSIAFTTGTKTYIYPDYITDSGILTSQLTLSPYAVRNFGGVADAPTIEQNPPSGGTGVITDQNGDTVYNIDIDFPSLDWLASAIQSILDFLHSLLDNITSLITRLIEAVENLLGDAFEGLQSFGQGIVEWIQTIIEALHDLMEEYIPSDIVGVLYTFMCLFIGVGLIKFVLGRL